VGQGSGMTNLFNATSKLLNKKFVLGSHKPDEGLDCFTLIINYLRNRGIDITDNESFMGFTFSNYKKEFIENPVKLMAVAFRYIETKAKKIPLLQATAGDIIVIKNSDGSLSFGIDSGNGFAIGISETDGVISLNKKDFEITMVYRCLE
jgi:hypothetical protein